MASNWLNQISDILVNEGDTAVFSCDVLNDSDTVQWFVNGNPISDNDRFTETQDGTRRGLKIHHCTVKDHDTSIHFKSTNEEWKARLYVQDLEENKRRWLVVSEALNRVISPILRKYLHREIIPFWQTIESNYNISIQSCPPTFQHYAGKTLNYQTINGNEAHGKLFVRNTYNTRYDYTVKTPVDLAKLFLPTHMSRMTGFDNTCDLSAALMIICGCDLSVRNEADQFRENVTIPWIHCNFTEWNHGFFKMTLYLMHDLVKCLNLSYLEEMEYLTDLDTLFQDIDRNSTKKQEDIQEQKGTIDEKHTIAEKTKKDLDGNQRRWLVVGEALNRIISPILRKYVRREMNTFWQKMESSHNISRQSFPPTFNHYSGKTLNYQTINGNEAHGKQFIRNTYNTRYDYTVKTPVDLAKLFLPTRISRMTGFDNTCDLNAALMIICGCGLPMWNEADQVRKHVHLLWFRCNYKEWDQMKFMTSFKRMCDLVKHLGLSSTEEVECLTDLDTLFQIIESLPSTLNMFGETWRQLYKNMLEHGKETKREIRVFVVGKKGAGKTCLTRHLRSKPIDDVTDTNGIEIHSVTCKDDDQCWNENVHTVDSRLLVCTKNTETTAKRNHEGIKKEGTNNENKGKNLYRPGNLPEVSKQYPAHYDKLDTKFKMRTFCTKYQMEFLGSTPANGNCFFEAISSQLRRFNLNQSPEELRQNVVFYLRENPSYQVDNEFVDIRDTVGDLSDYCDKMARDKEWADHVIVVMMARMLRMNIMIITSSPQATEDNCIVRVDGGAGASEDTTLLLGHYWETHYQSLQPKGNQSGTPTPKIESIHMQAQDIDNIETHSTLHDVEDSIGQDIEDMKDAEDIDVDALRIAVWDFGGDKEFYHTHHLFLVDDAVFLIVTRLDDYEDGTDCEKDVRFWFNTIHCLCKDSNTTNLKPRCIVVGTHKDKHKNEEAAYDVLIRKLDELPGKSLRNHIHGGLLLISNTEPEDKNIDDVKTAIINAAKESTEWETDHPTKFILLDKALEKRRCKHLMKPVITHHNLQSINKDLYQPLEENELKLYLFYNHSAGHLVYYEDIPEYIVIDPQWLSNLCRNFITADIFQRKLPQFLWKEFRSTGQITEGLIKAIFENQQIEDLSLQAYLMNVMEKFHVIINIPEKDAETESKRYFAPCMVKDNTIDKIYKIFEREVTEKSIWLCFNFEFLPPFVFDHIIICLCDEFTFAKHENGLPMFSSEGAVFEISPYNSEKLVFLKYKDVIQLQVLMYDKPKCQPYTYIKTLVTEKLREFTDKYSMTINYEYKWKCPESSYASNDGLMEFTGFAEKDKYYCNVCLRLHSFQNHWEEHLTSLTKEQTNYTRLGMIVIDVVVDALYDLLTAPLPSSHEARSVKNLQRDNCDIIKLYSLHMKLNLHVPSSGWSDSSGVLYQDLKDIPTTAVNVGDDIERCRLISTILNSMSQGAVDDSETEHLYQVLHDILSRLSNFMALLPTPSYIKKLETIKQKTMQLSDMEYVKEKIKAVIKVEITSGNKVTISPGSTTKISAKIECDLLVSDIKVLWQRVENNIPVTLNLSAMKYAGSSTNPPIPELVIKCDSQSDVGVYRIEVVSLTGSVVSPDVVIELFGESAEYSSKEEQNYQRLDKLCKDIGTKAMRMYFDRHVPKSTLMSHLNNFSADLHFNSRCRWKCTKVQYDILFPPYPAVVESCQLDITLLYKLIFNTISVINIPTRGWGPKPQTSDITEEDDIERIRHYRNDMSHITDGKLSDNQFGMWWTDLSGAICRLSNKILLSEVERLTKMKLDDENFQEQLDKHENRITSQGDMITSLKHNEFISRQNPWRCNLF